MTDLTSIKVIFPEKEIFLRLGGHLTKTELRSDEKLRFRTLALKAFEVCRPRGRWEIFKVRTVGDFGVFLEDGSFIAGGDFAGRCKNITHLWCGAVTIGHELSMLRDTAEKVSESAVFDAAGAETADAAMDMLQELARKELRRSGMFLAQRRYSPGYGDMPLDTQHFFFQKLQLHELDMSLSEALYMIPEKSVTAFAGITQEL